MKKHLVVIALVVAVLAGAYVVGHHEIQKNKSAVRTSGHAVHATQRQPASTTFNKSKYSLSDPTSLWVVVNKQRPLHPIDYAPQDLKPVGNGQYMRAAAAQVFAQLVVDAKTAGFTLLAMSAYRSYGTQTAVYNSEVGNYGQTQADNESARPGYSEHQTGWAVDIEAPGCGEDCFGSLPASKWLVANAYKYGFILRYPANKNAITGYRNEPWHFRYVGTDLAAEMKKLNITTLEEFFGLPSAPNY